MEFQPDKINFSLISSVIGWITKSLITFHDPNPCPSHQSGQV